MRAPISCQSKNCLRKMADLYEQLNSPQHRLLEKQNRLFLKIDKNLSSSQGNLLNKFFLYWIITGNLLYNSF